MPRQINVLMVYPDVPVTYWGLNHSLFFIGKKASLPPLGLPTVAAMFPDNYNPRIIDERVQEVTDNDLEWADLVMLSSMKIQRPYLERVIDRARRHGKLVVAGGPDATQYFDEIKGVDHFVLGEAESGTLEAFLEDYEKHLDKPETGLPKRVYDRPFIRPGGKKRQLEPVVDQARVDLLHKVFKEDEMNIVVRPDKGQARPRLKYSPVPLFRLLDIGAYASFAIQYSRGCPRDCTFCTEPSLFGHEPRVKTPGQIIDESEEIYRLGYRGSVFIVDDNFVGNKNEVKKMLRELIGFQEKYEYPFDFYTEADITLAGDKELMGLMQKAGFTMVFVGIESPDKDVLESMDKGMNLNMPLMDAVRSMQGYGMEVTAGLITGNDEDPDDICDKIFDFCQEAGIPIAMAGLLESLRGSVLHENLKGNGRLLRETVGGNTHQAELNFVPKRPAAEIFNKYLGLLDRLYDDSGINYFERCRVLMDNLGERVKPARTVGKKELRAFGLSMRDQTTGQPYSWEYDKFLGHTLLHHKKMFAEAVTYGVKFHHFHQITREVLRKNALISLQDNL